MSRGRQTTPGLSVAMFCLGLRNAIVFAAVSSAVACYRGSAEKIHSIAEQQLQSMSLEQLGNVEVTTASKQPEEVWKTPAAVSVITSEDIRRSSATTLPELLCMVSGVQVSRMQSDEWAVGIRGFTSGFSKDLLVLIDGRSVYTPLFEGVYWDVQTFHWSGRAGDVTESARLVNTDGNSDRRLVESFSRWNFRP